jgi:hypothetical protein
LESIIQFRQMMAEQKFSEVQKLIEVQLSLKSDARYELISIYYESLTAQQKKISSEHALELAEYESARHNYDAVKTLLNELSALSHQKYFIRVLKLKITMAEIQGQMDELYQCFSDFLLRQYEKQVPVIPDWIAASIEKYYRHDFNLQLKKLALIMLLNDVQNAEAITKELISQCVEKSSPRGTRLKLISIGEVLKASTNKACLEIYQNFCFLAANGIADKSDYKRIVEMVIFFDDFKFQALVLNLLHNMKLTNEAQNFAVVVRRNSEYDFVYFDKFFPHLKPLFFTPVKKKIQEKEKIPTPDLKLNSNYRSDVMPSQVDVEDSDDEQKFFHLIKYQTYSTDQLCDLAVSFLQSEMPKVALRASELAIEQSQTDPEFLKGSYLKLMSQLQLKDFRAALDTSFQALTRSKTRDDVLSFLYSQAEIYIRLNERKSAKSILSKILMIDSKYRLAKERYDKLNEI